MLACGIRNCPRPIVHVSNGKTGTLEPFHHASGDRWVIFDEKYVHGSILVDWRRWNSRVRLLGKALTVPWQLHISGSSTVKA